MKRNMSVALQTWKDKETRNPFYLTGVKGVGKTYLVCEFARSCFDSYLYVNFEHNKELVHLLKGQSEEKILSVLANYFEIPKEYIDTIPFVFDEVYCCGECISKLLNLAKEKLYWIFISSYDILKENEKREVSFHILYPLQFDEFLLALGKEWYIEVITAHYNNHKKLPDMVHRELLSIFDEYLWIGGMPDAVMEYLTMESSVNIVERQYIQKQIVLHSLSKIIEEPLNYKCFQIYSSIDEQLCKKNEIFQFSMIRKGITYEMYKEALEFLIKHQIVYRISSLEQSLQESQNLQESKESQKLQKKKWQQFKLFYSDFSFHSCTKNDELSIQERNIRLKNYLYQTFIQKNISCYFWEAKSKANLDFVVKTTTGYLPIELKQEKKIKIKSIVSFMNQYPCMEQIVRISSENFVRNDEFFNIPIYSLFCFEN